MPASIRPRATSTTPMDAARVLTAALEGAMLLVRSYADATRFAAAATRLLGEFTRVASDRGDRKSRPRARRQSLVRRRRG